MESNKSLHTSESKFDALFKNVPVGVFQSSPEGKILTANPAFLRILGYSTLEEFLSLDIERDIYMNPRHRRPVLQQLEEKTELLNAELVLKRKDGQRVVVLENAHTVRDESGRVLYYEGIMTDITERKKLEEELKIHRENLEKMVEERTSHLIETNGRLIIEIEERKKAELKLKSIAEELKRSNDELKQFTYVASHDLQEPLRMISSYAQLLRRRYKNKLDADADDFIAFLVDGVVRMKVLIDDLLSYSKLAGQSKEFRPTDCNQALENALYNLKAAVEEAKAVITRDSLPVVLADEFQMTQVFQNLVSNAVKFHGKEVPQVRIAAKRTEQEWIFSISDNGIGIPSEFFDRIFLIFQRLHSKSEYPGTGIGLAICKKIAERHGGRIWVESEIGKGSVFYFSLPAGGGGPPS